MSSDNDTTGRTDTTGVFALRLGTVTEFDVHRGLGRLAPIDRVDQTFEFHCTAIVDGSRTVDPGTRVAFVVGAAGPGRWEAVEVQPLA